jgi:ribonuclease BN (tRNA processing enzyme)
VIIDPGCATSSEKQALSAYISANNLEVKALLSTHCHIDHVLGNAYVLRTYPVEYYMHKLDLPVLAAAERSAEVYGIEGFEPSPQPNHFLEDKLTPAELDITKRIINTMSYSKVKKQGFPELHEYQMAYHVVREADLLAAYDFDRCMLYNIHMQTKSTINNPTPINNDIKILDAFNNASELFQNRVLKHNHDNLFITNYSKHNYLPLHIDAIKRINTWKNILKKPII